MGDLTFDQLGRLFGIGSAPLHARLAAETGVHPGSRKKLTPGFPTTYSELNPWILTL
jgi:hypothetical protein